MGILAAVVAVIAASFLPEAAYWHRHRDIRLYSAAREASARLEEFWKENARYPHAVDESSVVGQASERTARECRHLGHPVAAVEIVPVNGSDHGNGDEGVLVLWSSDGHRLVVLFRDTSIGVNRMLVTREVSQVPDWVRLVD